MNKTLYVLAAAAALAFQAETASAKTTYQCSGVDNPGFVVQTLGGKVPRVTPFDDATLQFADDKSHWDWMQLVSKQEGTLNAQYIYNLMLGGQLTISESVFVGRGGCGRGDCELPSSRKTISAKLVNAHGQESYYSCTKTI